MRGPTDGERRTSMGSGPGTDVQLNGGGTLDGGTYGTVTVNGVGTIRGGIACETLRVNGATTAAGDVSANVVEVNGTARIDGLLQAQTLTVNGETTLSSGAGVGAVSVKGRLTCYGDLNTRSLEVRGSLSVTGSVSSENADIEGILNADRLVAPAVRIGLHGPSSVREIEGQKVIVNRGTGWAGLGIMTLLGERRLTAASIAANEVSLELTTANSVRAGNAVLGEGCRIGGLAYSGVLEQRSNAAVTRVEKVEPS
jgi:cytoskeletal protein CcmA (bactofilin family)